VEPHCSNSAAWSCTAVAPERGGGLQQLRSVEWRCSIAVAPQHEEEGIAIFFATSCVAQKKEEEGDAIAFFFFFSCNTKKKKKQMLFV
jgi:hypothetical protein